MSKISLVLIGAWLVVAVFITKQSIAHPIKDDVPELKLNTSGPTMTNTVDYPLVTMQEAEEKTLKIYITPFGYYVAPPNTFYAKRAELLDLICQVATYAHDTKDGAITCEGKTIWKATQK